jgi:methionyl aminopeptidase
MIHYKSEADIDAMKKSCRLAASVLTFVAPMVTEGTSLLDLDQACHEYIVSKGAVPSPLNYKGYPKSICTSVNEVVCHGIPSKYRLKSGDIVNLDITTFFEGYHGDTSKTFLVGKGSKAARDLVSTTLESLWIGIAAVKHGGSVGDIGAAIQSFVEARGYSVVREYCGHGIGKNFHEDPAVTHYGRKGAGATLKAGMVFTIEPMINLGAPDIELLDDDWTVVTKDNKLSAQFEHTVAVREDRVEVLTLEESDPHAAVTYLKNGS